LSNGTASASTLTDLTGIWAKRDLDRLFLRVVGTELYVVNANDIEKLRTKAHRLLSDPSHDALSAIVAVVGAMLWSWPLVLTAAAYELASWAWAMKIAMRSRDEI
jgi:hypothetical protein